MGAPYFHKCSSFCKISSLLAPYWKWIFMHSRHWIFWTIKCKSLNTVKLLFWTLAESQNMCRCFILASKWFKIKSKRNEETSLSFLGNVFRVCVEKRHSRRKGMYNEWIHRQLPQKKVLYVKVLVSQGAMSTSQVVWRISTCTFQRFFCVQVFFL